MNVLETNGFQTDLVFAGSPEWKKIYNKSIFKVSFVSSTTRARIVFYNFEKNAGYFTVQVCCIAAN